MNGGVGFPAAIRYSSGSWRLWQLKSITVAGLRSDDGGPRARRLRAERCSREAAIYHGGSSSAENPVLPAPRTTALPPAADATLGGAGGHGAEPGEELLAPPILVSPFFGVPLAPPSDFWSCLLAPNCYPRFFSEPRPVVEATPPGGAPPTARRVVSPLQVLTVPGS